MTNPDDVQSALAPVRAALLARARDDAAAVLAAADADAQAAVREALAQAEAIRREARAQGEQDAATLRARERARAQREARAVVLRAQRAVYEELRARARAALRGLREDPSYPALLERLRATAAAQLGPEAVVTERADGGVVAVAPGRRIEASLESLADAAVDELGGEVAGLWAP